MRGPISRRGTLSTSSGGVRFSLMLQFGMSRKSWNTMPMLRRRNGMESCVRLATSRPMNSTRPASAAWSA
jgi:hypothetical protein